MTDFALDTLLSPMDDASPTGADLEYDADFLALERAASPRAERVMGDDVKAAEEPDWNSVAEMAHDLLQRSRDLRIAVHLANAWLHTSGLPGWAAGMGLVHGLLETFWDNVYPQLDTEDDNDPTERINAVVTIASVQGSLGYLHTAPFVQSPRMGRFSLRDLRIATGETTAPASGKDGEESRAPPSMAEIEACCMDCPETELVATVEAIDDALEHVRGIDQVFNEHVGTEGPELKPLLADMQELKKFLDAQLARRLPETAREGATDAGEDTDAGPTTAGVAGNGRINGPQDVMRRLDEVCDYYARAEPSSPVPLLLRRAQRLVGMTFEDLMKDLAPGGVSELQVVSGNTSDEE